MNQEKLKTIQFDHLSSWPFQFSGAIGMVCFVVGFIVGGWDYNYLMLIGQIVITLTLCRPFCFRRYVGWNKKGMQLKLGWLNMISFRFDEIQEVVVEDNRFWIMRMDGKLHEYDIAEIVPEDIQRLESLINRCTQLSKTISVAEN